MNSYGLVFGGEKTSHDSGNDIAYKVVSGNNYSQVVIEGDEYILPKEAMQSEKVYDFVDKLPIEMLDEIKRSENVFIQFPNLRQGDMVVCKNSVRNDDLHTIKGTAKEIANYLQGLSACRMYAKGGYISDELANGGGVEDESQLRLLTPMPPTKLGKTGIDSLTEIVGKDELREAMSGALYAGKGRIVATDAHILVVLENQNYPKSLDGTIKSLWNKVPQERLVGIPYPNWEAVVPNQQIFQTKELSIDDVLAYAYGGFLEGKNIIKEKDFNKYQKEKFKYVLRLNIGNIEIGIDSLLLTRILRTLKANDVRKISLHITEKHKPIKITTDNKHYGLIMPVMIADKVEDLGEGIYVSQQIFYPISDKDFRAMSKKYGEYLTEFSKMVGGLGANQIPTEYEYLATLRPISEAYPKENLIRLEEGGYNRYGIAVYSKPLSIREIEHFGFFPATEIKMIGTKIYYYEDFVAEIKTDINTIYLSKDIGGGEIEMELMSPTKFLEKIKSGEYRPLNEMAEGGEITMNVPLLLRVLELAKEDVKEDKELHFIAERLQSLSKKGTLTMEDYDYISGLESNDKIQKLIAENDSNDSDLRFEQGGEIEDLISRGIVDLKMYDTTPKHAKEYGFQCLNPLFVQTICVSESKRLKGLGTKVLSYIEKYAIENGHDLIFGHITQKAKFTKDKRETFFCDIDMIKNWLHSNGYAINNENNDFYKVIQSNKLEGGGSVLLAPNGKPSNLTPEQWHLVRTPEFKAWFGDWENDPENASKVVDKNGEPLVVFHASLKDFNVFDKDKSVKRIFHFGTISQAIGILQYFIEGQGIDLSPYVEYDDDSDDAIYWDIFYYILLSYYLSKQELDLFFLKYYSKRKGGNEKYKKLMSLDIKINKDLIKKELEKYNIKPYFLNIKNLGESDDMGEEWVVSDSYDGYIYLNKYEGNRDEYSYFVVEENQIKLADGSNTTFDANNPDIRYEQGGGIKKKSGLLAPNGKPSNLTPEQWHLVRTPEFKAWFGDWEALENAKMRDRGMDEITLNQLAKNVSKVVDENGEPLVCFHGTRTRGEQGIFSIFDIERGGESNTLAKVGFWFTPKQTFAKNFADNSWWGKEKTFVYAVFIKIKNPKVYTTDDSNYGDAYEKFRTSVYAIDGQSQERANMGGIGYALKNPKETLNKFRESLYLNGFDGIFIKNTRFDRGIAGGNNDQYVVLFSEQIKLANGTNTTFDGNNPDIRFESGGGVLLAPNGKPSNLTTEQWHLVRTPEFKAWFGDWENSPKTASKVVDENGEPLVLYRGNEGQMGKYGFEFKLGLNLLNKPNPQNFGFFFTDDLEIAKKYRKVDFYDSFIAGSITSIFLNAKKVLDITDFGHKIGQIDFVEGLVEKGIKFDLFEGLLTKIITFFEEGGEYKGWGNNTFDYFDVFPELRDLFLANGYKAIIFQEISRSYFPYKVFVAFESNQIKLADGTNTTFDGNNPDIRFESGGEIDRGLARKKQDISFDDFHIATFANFKKIRQVDLPKREPDFVSKSGSKYWYEGDKVYRMSNHWGRIIASCNWLLDGFAVRGLSQGYCKLKDFHREMSFLLNDKNVGKRFLVGKTSFLRSGKGAIDISENEGVFIKETSGFYVFDAFKVSKMTLAYVKPMQKVNYE